MGLQPGRRNSGESEPQMHISKEGDGPSSLLLIRTGLLMEGLSWRKVIKRWFFRKANESSSAPLPQSDNLKTALTVLSRRVDILRTHEPSPKLLAPVRALVTTRKVQQNPRMWKSVLKSAATFASPRADVFIHFVEAFTGIHSCRQALVTH